MVRRRIGRWSLVALLVPLSAFGVSVRAFADTPAPFRAWVDKNIPRLLQRYRVPGAAIALVEHGKVTWARGYGLADIRDRRSVSNETVFQVASISKSLTAWGVMKLAEKGLIDLDAPVDRYLKRWHLPASPYNDEVTVRRVLSHTAGLSLHGYPGNDPTKPLPTLVESLSGRNSSGIEVRVVTKPGTHWSYSGGGYTVLQLLIEDVTGVSFESHMKEAILSPLGMNHSSYAWEPRLRPATARAYSQSPHSLPNYLYPEKAAAGLYTTASDLGRFVAAVTSPTAHGVLEPASLRAILTPAPKTFGAFGAYGFAVSIERLAHGERLVQHTGGNRGWSAIWLALPEKDEGLVVLTNSNTGSLLYVDTSCVWSRLVADDTPQACSALSGLRSFVTGGTIAVAAVLVAYLATFALGVSDKRRVFRRPRGLRWNRLLTFPLLAAVWVAFWHTTLATGALALGLTPSLVMPLAFSWASPVVVLSLLLLAATTVFPRRVAQRPASLRRRLVIATTLGALWLVFLYTDALSRLIVRTPGPRPTSLLSTGATLVTTIAVVGVIFAVCLLYRRHTAVPGAPNSSVRARSVA